MTSPRTGKGDLLRILRVRDGLAITVGIIIGVANHGDHLHVPLDVTGGTEELRLWFASLDAEPDITVLVSHDVDDIAASGLPRH